MRKKYSLIILLFSTLALGGDESTSMLKDGKGSVSGYLDTSTVPYRLLINHEQQNQEVIFLSHLKSAEGILYDQQLVTVSGTVTTYREVQYLMNVEKISIATKAELALWEK